MTNLSEVVELTVSAEGEGAATAWEDAEAADEAEGEEVEFEEEEVGEVEGTSPFAMSIKQ